MPLGTGTDTMHNVPATPFTPSPARFDALTNKNHHHGISVATPGPGLSRLLELPKAGILTWLTITFDGTLTYNAGSGSITTAWTWPYGILKNLAFAANLQNGLVNASGVDLHVMRNLLNPSYEDAVDTIGSGTSVGGGNAITGTGTKYLHLTYQVPVVMDKVTLAGCIYAQSNQNALTLAITEAVVAEYLTLTGNATASLSGTWTVGPDIYEIPMTPEEGIITPDLSRLHALQARETAFAATGAAPVELTQVNGQLCRLLVQVRHNDTAWLAPKPASTTPDLTRLTLTYGANQTPLDYSYAELVAKNNEHYGAPLPYGYVCLDFVRESAVRDAVFMPGLTELKVTPYIGSGVTVTSAAKVRIVQEMLFQ